MKFENYEILIRRESGMFCKLKNLSEAVVRHSKEGTKERNWGQKEREEKHTELKQFLKIHFKVLSIRDLPHESVMVDKKYIKRQRRTFCLAHNLHAYKCPWLTASF